MRLTRLLHLTNAYSNYPGGGGGVGEGRWGQESYYIRVSYGVKPPGRKKAN